MERIHVYMCCFIASVESTAGNKNRFFCSPLLISTSWFLILAEAFRNDHVAACSTALRSATEKNEMGGYVTFPRSSKMTQRSSTALLGVNSSDITRLVATEHVRNKNSLLKSSSILVVINRVNLLTLSVAT